MSRLIQGPWSDPNSTQPLCDRALLSFPGASGPGSAGAPALYGLTFSEATCGVIALGATGSGKTANLMKPALCELVQASCPGIVLDVKGDYTDMLRELCPERLVIVGPAHDATPINLIGGVPPLLAKTLLQSLRIPGKDFWGSSAVEDAFFVHQALIACEMCGPSGPTLAQICEILSEPHTWCFRLVTELMLLPQTHPIQKIYKRRLSDRFSFVNHDGAQDGFTADNTRAEQYSWHMGHLLPSLGPFADIEELRRSLSAKDSAPWADLIYEQNKIIVFDMPNSVYGNASYTASKLLRALTMSAILGDKRKYEPARGFGRNKFSFMLVDEYQAYANAQSHESGSGLIDDNTFFDRSRSFHHINIVATQGLSSLDAQIGRQATDSVLQNLRSKLYLPTDDPRTLERASTTAGANAVDWLTNPPGRFTGIWHCPVSTSCRTATLIEPRLIEPTAPSTVVDLALSPPAVAEERSDPETVEIAPLQPDALTASAHPMWMDAEKLVLLCPPGSRGALDFMYGLRDGLRQMRMLCEALHANNAQLNRWASLSKDCAIVTIAKHDSPTAWVNQLELIEQDSVQSGKRIAVVITRGGGSVTGKQFSPYSSPTLDSWMSRFSASNQDIQTTQPDTLKRTAKLHFFIALAHTIDSFPIEAHSELRNTTPQGMGYAMANEIAWRCRETSAAEKCATDTPFMSFEIPETDTFSGSAMSFIDACDAIQPHKVMGHQAASRANELDADQDRKTSKTTSNMEAAESTVDTTALPEPPSINATSQDQQARRDTSKPTLRPGRKAQANKTRDAEAGTFAEQVASVLLMPREARTEEEVVAMMDDLLSCLEEV